MRRAALACDCTVRLEVEIIVTGVGDNLINDQTGLDIAVYLYFAVFTWDRGYHVYLSLREEPRMMALADNHKRDARLWDWLQIQLVAGSSVRFQDLRNFAILYVIVLSFAHAVPVKQDLFWESSAFVAPLYQAFNEHILQRINDLASPLV